ncbi:TorF family putative porin [Massilia sp. DWR3-1-1]|uniref:TorF family putative porin n=1 Tax=Massilia sp. DWR3-1-1 TaxID=2804559 RepID=UPI003CEC84A7
MFPDHRLKKFALSLIALCLAAPARSQTSADLSLLSQYAGRGVAFDPDPVLQLRVEHDTDQGWYGGVFASPVAIGGRRQGQLTTYGGRAQRLSSTLSWDAGISRSVYLRDASLNYHEWYVGLALDRASARLFYSPAYYGDERSVYLDLNGAYPLGERLSLALHGGLLHPLDEPRGAARLIDLRLALVADLGDYSLQAGWQVKGQAYLAGTTRARALTASISRRF